MRRANNQTGFVFAEEPSKAKKARKNNQKTVKEGRGKLLGVSLGFDFTSEHEWGIQGIREVLAIGAGATEGAEKRRVTRIPEIEVNKRTGKLHPEFYSRNVGMTFATQRGAFDQAILALSRITAQELIKATPESIFSAGELRFRSYGEVDQQNFTAAWDADEFAINVRGEENVAHLTAIFKAFQEKRIYLGMRAGSPFVRGDVGGLFFLLEEVFTPEARAAVLLADRQAAASKQGR